MGLVISTQYGIPVVSHGGSLFGYKSDMIFLPHHGVGAVILTNSDTGGFLTRFFSGAVSSKDYSTVSPKRLSRPRQQMSRESPPSPRTVSA